MGRLTMYSYSSSIDSLIQILQVTPTKNIRELLQQALTRQKAIEENVPGAARENYHQLEFLGDAILTLTIRKSVLAKKDPSYTLEEITHCTEVLIGNATILPEVGRTLNLERFIIKGRLEVEVTSKMLADAVEAILGAIVTVSTDQAMQAIERLWSPYLSTAYLKQLVTKKRAEALSSSPSAPSSAAAPLVVSTSVPLKPATVRNTPAAEAKLYITANNPNVGIK